MTLGERLRKSRRTAKLTQEDVSRKLDIDLSTVSKWENGKNTPNLESLRALAELYHVSLPYLLDEEETDRYQEFDAEVLEAFANASPDVREHFQKYLRGEVDEPIFFTAEEKRFTKDLEQGIELLDLFDRYAITINGVTPTREELEEVIKFFKAMRIMKMM